MKKNAILYLLSTLLCLTPLTVFGDGAQDNRAENVRKIPPPGVPIPADVRQRLEAGIAQLGAEITSLRTAIERKPVLLELLPDVQIYYNAVRYAVANEEFFNTREFATAQQLLEQGMERAKLLREGKAPWETQTGLVARGYISKIDGSVQPYGLVVPSSYQAPSAHPFRLDVWFHGRGETLSEVNFLRDRQTNPGEFTPANTFVLHPYGRYCNANKIAGEVDTFEAIAHIKKHYPIDENRVSVRGFSMGGAACWQFAVHFPGEWAAAAPGAGFSETADFLKVFQNEKVKPTWYEQALWHVYDCTDYALNIFNLPTVAYSGEKDGQKQAADMMSKAMAKEGIALTHIIGPGAGHFYEAKAKAEVSRRIDSIVAIGRNPVPKQIRFVTYWLRYNRSFWVQVEGLEKHWSRAEVNAEIADTHTIKVKTKNINALTLTMAPGQSPLDNTTLPKVVLDGRAITAPAIGSDRSWEAHFRKTAQGWQSVETLETAELHKHPGLQGPIDDAFWDSFLMVTPTGSALNPAVGAWVAGEQKHAITHWRQQFRGEARVKTDTEVTAEDIANHNLVLWGDPSSNKILQQLLAKLPIGWSAQAVQVGAKQFDASHHVPILIFPNPLNPKKYVVVNSGFTYREYDYLNNARQVPKLPDYAVVDVNVPSNSRAPGGVVEAGFFNEEWAIPTK